MEQKGTCFIICPIGETGSEIRIKSTGLIDSCIKPSLEPFFVRTISPLDLQVPGDINDQIINLILNSDLVIANLTGLNPNVMYELAVRHATRKPVIILAERNTKLPFDIYSQRTIFYDDSMSGSLALKEELTSNIEPVILETIPDNPIYKGLASSIIKSYIPDSTPDRLIFSKLENIERLMLRQLNVNKPEFRIPQNTEYEETPSFSIKLQSSLSKDHLMNLSKLFSTWHSAIQFIRPQVTSNQINIHLTKHDTNGLREMTSSLESISLAKEKYGIEEIIFHW